MKGSKKVIEALNAALADELGAINQYMVHAEMCENWGYGKLHDTIKQRAIEEMKHAETLIARLLFLDGDPVVSKLSPIHIGATVPKMMDYDLEAELGAVKLYNSMIKLCIEAGDKGSAEVFDHLLQDEERHVDWLEAQKDQMAQMTLPIYLATQAR